MSLKPETVYFKDKNPEVSRAACQKDGKIDQVGN